MRKKGLRLFSTLLACSILFTSSIFANAESLNEDSAAGLATESHADQESEDAGQNEKDLETSDAKDSSDATLEDSADATLEDSSDVVVEDSGDAYIELDSEENAAVNSESSDASLEEDTELVGTTSILKIGGGQRMTTLANDDEDDSEEIDEDGDEESDEKEEPELVEKVFINSIDKQVRNGCKPIYTARVSSGNAEVAYEYWGGDDYTINYSNSDTATHYDDCFTTFKKGTRYTYNIYIKAKDSDYFDETTQVYISGELYKGSISIRNNRQYILITDLYSYQLRDCNHEYTKKAVKATCTTDGYTEYICKYCDYSYNSKYVNKLGHTYELSEDDSSESSCTKNGCEVFKCKNCDSEYKKILPVKTHTLEKSTTPASREEYGAIQYNCSECEKTISSQDIPKIKSISLSRTSCAYTGKAIRPSVIVRLMDGRTLSSEYYTATYYSNTGLGTAEVLVHCKGLYDDSETLRFKIVAGSQKITTSCSSRSFLSKNVNKKAQSFSLNAKSSGKTKLKYASSNKKYVTVSSSGKVTVKKKAKKGTYKITITAAKSKYYKESKKVIKVIVK